MGVTWSPLSACRGSRDADRAGDRVMRADSGQVSPRPRTAPPVGGDSTSEHRAAPRGGEPRQDSASWSYAMRGQLDDESLRCTGRVRATVSSGAGARRCWSWQIVNRDCSGNRSSVDWLHADANGGEICQRETGWELMTQLPGRAFCSTEAVERRGEPARFVLSCTWECRSAANPCSGQATYRFEKTGADSGAPRPAPRDSRAPPVARGATGATEPDVPPVGVSCVRGACSGRH